jgi:Tol biopolymer transport system component
MESMASEMPPPEGIPRRLLSRARRRAVTVLALTMAVVVAVAAGAVVGVEALTGRHEELPAAPGPAPSQESSPAAEQIRFVRMYRDGSSGAAVDDGYEGLIRWSLFTIDPQGGTPVDLGAPVDSGYGSSVAWSPDGSRIAFGRFSQTGPAHGQIWTVRIDGSDPRQLTADDAGGNEPAWSPDGAMIAFLSDRADPLAHQVGHAPISDLYVMNADGTGVIRLTKSSDCGGNGVTSPSWSPDGSRLVFAMPHLEGSACWFDLFAVHADGTSLTQLSETSGREGQSDWSPDGTRIVFDRYGGGSSTDVFLIQADGTGEARLTGSTANDFDPVWSPDGSRIVFSSQRNWDEAGDRLFEGDPGNADLYVMNADGSAQTRLTDDGSWDGAATWVTGG